MSHKITTLKTVLTQPHDDCDELDVPQEITIETADGGAGPYCVISTRRWAIESEEELDLFLNAIRKAMNENILNQHETET